MIRKKTKKKLSYVLYRLAKGLTQIDKENPKSEKGKTQKAKETELFYNILRYSQRQIERMNK